MSNTQTQLSEYDAVSPQKLRTTENHIMNTQTIIGRLSGKKIT